MVVADDEINSFLLGIGNLVDSLDATIKNNNELDALLLCIIYTLY